MTPELRNHWAQNPMAFKHALWPRVDMYPKQVEIIHSVRDDNETYVTAGNMLGKDFVAGFIILWFFVCHHPVKIITTSATEKHLNNLWGEINRFIRESELPLTADKGGPIKYNNMAMYKVVNGVIHEDSYTLGMVASSPKEGENVAGHHAKHTLFVCDEASGVVDVAYAMAQGWAKRMLIIGNPNPCNNFFYRGVKGGNVAHDNYLTL
jgi:phage terminase large subunit